MMAGVVLAAPDAWPGLPDSLLVPLRTRAAGRAPRGLRPGPLAALRAAGAARHPRPGPGRHRAPPGRQLGRPAGSRRALGPARGVDFGLHAVRPRQPFAQLHRAAAGRPAVAPHGPGGTACGPRRRGGAGPADDARRLPGHAFRTGASAARAVADQVQGGRAAGPARGQQGTRTAPEHHSRHGRRRDRGSRRRRPPPADQQLADAAGGISIRGQPRPARGNSAVASRRRKKASSC